MQVTFSGTNGNVTLNANRTDLGACASTYSVMSDNSGLATIYAKTSETTKTIHACAGNGPSPFSVDFHVAQDSYGAGIPDWWILQYFASIDTYGASPYEDSDGDGLTNLDEYTNGTNPKMFSTAGDGISDGWKMANGMNPVNPISPSLDSDGNSLPDVWEISHFGHIGVDPGADADGDRLTNLQEYQRGTDPTDYYNNVRPIAVGVVNTSSLSVTVAGLNGASLGPVLLEDSGTAASNVIEFTLHGQDGSPLQNAPISFSLSEGSVSSGCAIAETAGGTQYAQVTALTDINGVARVYVVSSSTSGGQITVQPVGADTTYSDPATRSSTNLMSIDLGENTLPVGIAIDGTITLKTIGPDGGPALARWHNGSMSFLPLPPKSLYLYSEATQDNIFFPFVYEDDPTRLGIGLLNRNGMLAVETYDGFTFGTHFSGYSEQFVIVWPAGSSTPYAIKGPVSTYTNLDDPNQVNTSSYAKLYVIDNHNDLLVQLEPAPLNLPEVFDASMAHNPVFSATQLQDVLEADGQYVDIYDMNASHITIGQYRDRSNEPHYFVGTPDSSETVDFIPLAINDAGMVLGEEIDGPGLIWNGEILPHVDAYTSNVIQQTPGYIAYNPFVYFSGEKHYLMGVNDADTIRVVGIDEAGNVYGSMNATYTGAALLDPGKNVIWVSDPVAWGLPAGTSKYAPVLWELPTLSGGQTALSGVAPVRNAPAVVSAQVDDGLGHFTNHAVLILPAQMAVDANGDGNISSSGAGDVDVIAPDQAFHFWINDDDDDGDTYGTDIPGQPGTGAANGTSTVGANYSTSNDGGGNGTGRVDGVRDLVDFFPVYLDIKQLLAVLPPSDTVKYKVKHAEGALNFVESNLTRAHALDYQRPAASPAGSGWLTTGFGIQLRQAPGEAQTQRMSVTGVTLSPEFIDAIQNHDGGVILVEGRAPTTQPLVLSVEKPDGTVIAHISLPISISPVENMYRRLNLREGPDAPTDAPDASSPGLVGQRRDTGLPTSMGGPPNLPDTGDDQPWFIFVAGSNVGGQNFRGWQSEVFKRMYWSHSHARFVGVSWFGDPYSNGNIIGHDFVYDYHMTIRNTFTTAPKLAEKLNALSGSKTIAGHSAACVLISSAVADFGLQVNNACLLDAALAREAFDGPVPGDSQGMTPDAWLGYNPQLWASYWFTQFPSTDARSGLTWRHRFDGAASVVQNFYSSTEEVLAAFPGTPGQAAWENVKDYFTGQGTGSYVWVVQEKTKGNLWSLLDVVNAGSTYGGWGFNTTDPLSASDPVYYDLYPNTSGVPTRQVKSQLAVPASAVLRRTPVFDPGWGNPQAGGTRLVDTSILRGPGWIRQLYDTTTDTTTGSTTAAAFEHRSRLLAEAIPALSLPMGANRTTAIEDQNHNEPAEFVDVAHWPSARGSDASTGTPIWHHSDMREVAYIYLYKFYDKLVSITNQ